MAELFDKKFVHFMWDDSLQGKRCFVSDSIKKLQHYVNTNDTLYRTYVEATDSNETEFHTPTGNYKFAYYDKHYDCKLAFSQGKTIQYRYSDDHWVDVTVQETAWSEGAEYRVKPDDVPADGYLNKKVSLLDGTGKSGVVTGYDPVNEEHFVAGRWYKVAYLKLL